MTINASRVKELARVADDSSRAVRYRSSGKKQRQALRKEWGTLGIVRFGKTERLGHRG
jgi:hypothetical protein